MIRIRLPLSSERSTGHDLSFAGLSERVRASTNALVIGVRDPRTGEQRINPPDETPVDAQIVDLAEGPIPEVPGPAGEPRSRGATE